MEKEWLGETAWAVIFALTALSAVVLLMSAGTIESVRLWIEAIGGLAGAIFVIPTIILLRRQTFVDEVQSKLAIISDLERQKTQIRLESAFSREMYFKTAEIQRGPPMLRLTYSSEAVTVDVAIELDMHFSTCKTQLTQVNAEIWRFNTDNPSGLFGNQRVNATKSIQRSIGEIDKIQGEFVQLHSIRAISGADIADFIKRIDNVFDEARRRAEFIDWQQKAAEELTAIQVKIDAIGFVH